MKIRKATLKDLGDIVSLNKALFRDSLKFDRTLDLNWPKNNIKYFKKSIRSKNSVALVAEENGLIVGYLIGAITKSEDYRKIKKFAELENMLVLPQYRGKKIGTYLIKEFIKWAKLNKVNIGKVLAYSMNEGAVKIYKKNSFKEYATILEIKL